MDDKCVEIVNRCLNKWVKLDIHGLTAIERIIILVNHADFEIIQGGFSTLYYNSTGDNAVEIVAALREIGALIAAQAIENANALSSTPYPRDRVKRYDEWKQFVKTKPNPLAAYNDTYFAQDPDVWSLLCDFVEAHINEFEV